MHLTTLLTRHLHTYNRNTFKRIQPQYEASNQIYYLFTSMQLLMEKQASSRTPQTHAQFWTLSPIKNLKVSPKHDGSTLYDSFELRAITHQLNKAIQASKCVFSTIPVPLKKFSLLLPTARPYLQKKCKDITESFIFATCLCSP